MSSRVRVFILVFLLAFLTACDGGGGGGEQVDLTGNWSGTWASTVMTSGGTLLGSLTHIGTSVRGTISITGSPCISSGTVSGTGSGGSFSASVVSGEDAINLEGTYTATSISGTYSVPSGICTGDSGTFSLRKGEGGVIPVITTLTSGLSSPSNLIVKGTNLFLSDSSERPVKEISLTDGAITLLAKKMGVPSDITISGQYMYWIDAREGYATSCVGQGVIWILHKTSVDGIEDTILSEGDNCAHATSDIVVDDENVYWVLSLASPNTYNIEMVPNAGGAPTILTNTLTPIVAMTRDATHLFWLEQFFPDSGTIKKMSLGGGVETVVVDGSAGTFNAFVGGFALHGMNIFFAEILYPYPYSGARLYKFSLTDGSTTILGDLPTLPNKFVADDKNVYWIDDTSVNTVPISGGTISTLADGLNSPIDIAVDAESVYWTESTGPAHRETGSIKSILKLGGAPAVLTQGGDAPRELDLDTNNIYWTEGGPIGQIEGFGRIAKAPKSGGSITTVVSGVMSGSSAIAADDSNVYIADKWTVKKVPHGGDTVEKLATLDFDIADITTDGINVYATVDGPYTVVSKISTADGTVTTLSNELSGPAGPIAIEDAYVYWMAQYDIIAKVSINGGATETLATSLPFLSDFVIDSASVYFSEQDTGDIKRMPVGGGEITTLTNRSFICAPHILTVDGSSLYWVNQCEVGKLPKDGGNTTIIAEQLNSVATFPNSIVVDDTSVYWTEVGVGTIKKATPK